MGTSDDRPRMAHGWLAEARAADSAEVGREPDIGKDSGATVLDGRLGVPKRGGGECVGKKGERLPGDAARAAPRAPIGGEALSATPRAPIGGEALNGAINAIGGAEGAKSGEAVCEQKPPPPPPPTPPPQSPQSPPPPPPPPPPQPQPPAASPPAAAIRAASGEPAAPLHCPGVVANPALGTTAEAPAVATAGGCVLTDHTAAPAVGSTPTLARPGPGGGDADRTIGRAELVTVAGSMPNPAARTSAA